MILLHTFYFQLQKNVYISGIIILLASMQLLFFILPTNLSLSESWVQAILTSPWLILILAGLILWVLPSITKFGSVRLKELSPIESIACRVLGAFLLAVGITMLITGMPNTPDTPIADTKSPLSSDSPSTRHKDNQQPPSKPDIPSVVHTARPPQEPKAPLETGYSTEGYVVDEEEQIVANATVSVDGQTKKTDSTGYFTLTVRGQSNERKLFRITKAGYLPWSESYSLPVTNKRFILKKQ